MGTDEKYIDNLFSKIKVFERKLISKNKEIKDLERYLVLPGDKNNKNPGLIKTKTSRSRPHTINKTTIDASSTRNRRFEIKN